MTRSSQPMAGNRDEVAIHSMDDLDDVDQQILSALTADARNTSSSEIADKVDVTPATIRNRIEKLVSAGVIEAHRTEIDYRALGLLEFLFICTVDPNRFGEITGKLSTLPEVIQVRELLNGSHNLHVMAVVETQDQAEVIERRLTDMPLEIETISLVGNEEHTPIGFFSDTEQSGTDNE